MNSEKAANIRDAINGLPCVAHNPDETPIYGDDTTTISKQGRELTYTGACVDTEEYTFSPATINKAGEIAFDENAAMRPCYEVILQPITIPTRPLPTISLPPSVVHEIAKYDCRVRVTAGLRDEFTPGTVRIRDDVTHTHDPASDGERCENCRGTRFKVKHGVPKCVRCGTTLEETTTQTEHEITTQ